MWANVWIVRLFWVVVNTLLTDYILFFTVLSVNLEVNSGSILLILWYCRSRCFSWKVFPCSVCQGLIQCVWLNIVCISICQNFQTVICMTPARPWLLWLHTTLSPASAVFAAKMVVLSALIDCGSSLIGNTNRFRAVDLFKVLHISGRRLHHVLSLL